VAQEFPLTEINFKKSERKKTCWQRECHQHVRGAVGLLIQLASEYRLRRRTLL
jgi:hypothetical protein